MKVKLDGVAETLLITLYVRAKDAMSENSILNDQKSLEIMREIDYDFSKFDNSKASFFGTLARACVMDREIKNFINRNPRANIVYIGCGLDTRFERIDNGQVRWYNLDFPEVIEIRKSFFEDNERVFNIPKSATDRTWTEDIFINGEPLLIVSEGVLMYLQEDEVRTFLNILTDSFDGFVAQFDLIYKEMVNKGKKHGTVKHTNVDFNFGVTDGHEIVDLNPKLRQVGFINFTDKLKTFKLGWLRLFLPIIRRMNNRLCIYEYRK